LIYILKVERFNNKSISIVFAALKVKLMVRRPHSQLVEQGIIPCK